MKIRNPIPRVGLKEALFLIREKKYTLLGRELISPPKKANHITRYQFGNDIGGNAEYHVMVKTAILIKKELDKQK